MIYAKILKIISVLILILTKSFLFGQSRSDAFYLDANYGAVILNTPQPVQFCHFDIGGRYMLSDYIGVKLDFGFDKAYKFKKPTYHGVDYTRYSVMAVGNVLNILDYNSFDYNEKFNIYASAGFGLSTFRSELIPGSGKDNTGHIIIGVNPQYTFMKNVSVGLNLNYLMNLSQHYNFSGTYTYDNKPRSVTTGMGNIGLGISVLFE